MTDQLLSNAQLSLASYAKLIVSVGVIDQRTALQRAGFTPTQALQFAASYPTIVSYFDDPTSGFQVSVFKDTPGNSAGNLTVAFRGTELPEDLATAIDIGGSGAAYSQIVAMVNWWLRASKPKGEQAQQYRLVSYALADVPTDAVVIRSDLDTAFVLDTAPDVAASGEVAAALAQDPDLLVDVTGHSLGGHLAMAFSSIFAAQTGAVTVFNAPGFIDSQTNEDFFSKLGGAIPTGLLQNGGSIVNVAADEALVDSSPFDFIAGLHSRPGEPHDVAIENQVNSDEPVPFLPALNHSILALTDSLAVYKLLTELSPGLSESDYRVILNQVVPGTAASYERIVDALESLFGINNTYLPVGNTKREALYQAIYGDGNGVGGLVNNPTYKAYQQETLQITASAPDASTLISEIQNASGSSRLAYGYALTRLNTFVAADPTDGVLYAQFRAGGDNAGELDPYDAARNPQGLTDTYVADRANFLERKLWFNTQDIDPVNPDYQISGGDPVFLTDDTLFSDAASGYVIAQGFQPTDPFDNIHRYNFGSDGADVAAGGQLEDHLYGGSGDDFLRGDLGNDYLEGDAGLDVYLFQPGDGADTVLDGDGMGMLIRDGAVLSYGMQQSADVWAFANTTFTRSGSDLVVSFADGSGDSITVMDFDFAAAQGSGYMGIQLEAAASGYPQNPVRTFFGDKADWDSDPNTAGIQTQLDAYGNTVRADGQDGRPDIAEADRTDLFYGSSANEVEKFVTGGGDDTVYADGPDSVISANGGRDLIETGAGRDIVAAGAGDDWVEGGSEGDILAGNAGDDVVYADSSNGQTLTLAQAIAAGASGTEVAGPGDLLTGDAGNDLLIGAETADFLAGGDGADVIVGGLGADNIYGDASVASADLAWTQTRSVTVVNNVNNYVLTGTGYAFTAEPTATGADTIYGGAGADWVFAGAGDDYVEGGEGDDVLFGEAGADTLIGGAGNDHLEGDSASVDAAGGSGDDYLDGGAGDDTLNGDKGDDILVGGEGVDVLAGGDGADLLWGGPGDDTLLGGAGKDTYVYNRGDGVDTINDPDITAASQYRSTLVLGTGISRADVKFRLGSLMIDLGQGDAIHFEGFNPDDPLSTRVLDSIQFADGSAMSYQDVLDQGFDLAGTDGDDDIQGTVVSDRIDALGGNDRVVAKAGDDTILGGDGDDLIDAGAGDDVIDGGPGQDIIDAGAGNDTIQGGDGDDLIDAGAGDDVIDGGAGQDVIDAGAGNDVLAGGAGTDSYVLYGGMGQDTATDGEGGETNVLQLGTGLTLDNLYAAQAGNDLTVGLRGLTDTITIKEYFVRAQDWVVRDANGGDTPIATLIGAPDPYANDFVAQLWNNAKQGQIASSAGAAYLIGWKPLGGTLFQGFQADAWLTHDEQTTTETFTRASEPYDVLGTNVTQDASTELDGYEGQPNPNPQFVWSLHNLETGSLTSDASVIYGGGSRLPQIVTSGEAILSLRKLPELYNFQQTQYSTSGGVVSYDTGTEVVLASVMYDYDIQHYNQFASIQGVSEDTSTWSAPVDQLVFQQVLVDMTKVENRYLSVYEIFAGPSDNVVYTGPRGSGDLGFITLVDGGAGNDALYGKPGDLLYGNSGNDTLTASGATLIGGDGDDTLIGHGGTRFVFTATEVGQDAVSETATWADQYLNWFYTSQGVSNWRESADHGGQYYVDGEGRIYYDTLEEAQTAFPGWDIGYVEPLPSPAPVVRRSDAATIDLLTQAGVMPLDAVQFGPGLSLSDLDLTLTVSGQIADAHPELPSYGGGTLSVSWGSGAGFRVAVPDVQYGFAGDDAAVDPAGSYRLGEGVELFEFADGSSYTLDAVLAQATLVKHYGYEFLRGSGSQVIDGTWPSVDFGNDISPSEVSGQRDGMDLVFQLSDYSAQGRIVDWYADPAAVPQMAFEFADGTTFDTDTVTRLGLTQYGTAGFDFLDADPDFASALYGLGGQDFLTGGAGNDLLDAGPGGASTSYLSGRGGDDIYVFGVGYGSVSIDEDIEDGGTGLDTVRFGAGIGPQDVVVSRDYGDLKLTVGLGGDTLNVFRWLDAAGGTVERFEFPDGTFWDGAAVAAMLPGPDTATEGDDLLYGAFGDDALDGLGGNDEVAGFAGNDTLSGGDGDDYVEGGAGFDLLYGGAGADDMEDWEDASLIDAGSGDDYAYDEGNAFVIGGPGDDWIDHYGDGGVIAFNPGDGNDTINVAGAMTLSIGGGAQPADLSLGQDGTDLIIDVAGTDSIRLTTSNPAAWPAITLQMFGSVHEYDFNAVIADYEAQAAGDPSFVLSLDGVLQAHETATSGTDALGGAIAWQYATTGSTAALSLDDLRTVLSDPSFGIAAQPISLAPANSAPTLDVPIADQTANEDSAYSFTLPAGTFSDPDAGDALSYDAALADGSPLPGWLAFDPSTQTFSGTPLQADVGAIDLRVTATDVGGLSASDTFTLNIANVNEAPVVAAADAELLLGDAAAAASLFSVADEDGDIPVQYELWDDVAGGGYFSVNGVAQNAGAAIAVSAADLANAEYVAGSTPGIERVWARAYDGQAWSAWTGWNMTSALHIPDAAPEATPAAATQTALLDAAAGAATLFSVGDADGDPVVQYQFWDDVDGGGYFSVNGVAQAAGAAITVDAADLANTQYIGGSASGAETVWVRATDGQLWGAWKSWTMRSWPHATNSAPVATAADGEVLRNASVAAASLFSISDADGDSVTQYELWDDTAGGGYFSVAGVPQDTNPIPVDAAQLADVSYVGGADPGVEQVWVRASDGLEWGAWTGWHMTTALHIPDAAPEATPIAAAQTVLLGQAVDASTLFGVSDADGDPVASYELFDSTAGGGHFAVNGVEQGVNVAIPVSAADLANTQFVAAADIASDQVWVRATDGQSWGAWKSWTMNSWPHATNSAPVADASAGQVLQNEAVAAATLFSVSDADADPVTQYELWDDVNGGGSFRVNGIQQAAGQAIAVSAADLVNTEYVGGANPGTEQVWVRASDGMQWGAWKGWSMTTALHLNDAAPVVTTSTRTALLGQTVDAASLFGVSDADGDPIASYEFFDSTAGGGHFTVNGVEQGVNVSIPVSAADLANTQFVASNDIATDQLWVRATDGQSWGDWKSWTQNSWPHLANSAPVASAGSAGVLENEALPVSMFFSTSDADGDPVAQYQFWDDVNGGGYFQFDGVQQAAGQAIPVSAADLANVDYVGGAAPGTEQVWVRASDGMGWGAWKNWLMSTEGGALRGGSGPDTLNGDPSTPILEGGGGDDNLTAADVNSLLSGGSGNDTETGGAGNDLLAGGAGDDTIDTGAGDNVILFNAGDGVDTVYSAAGAQNTLSFGGGITYDDLSLSKNGNDLIVNVGQNDKVVLKDWYAGYDTVLSLQIVLDATSQFDPNSSDPLYDNKVETFDFAGLVNEFDQALAQSPGLTSWQVTNALLAFHLSGSDDSALGGDLAYWYGKNGGFTGISVTAAQQVLGDAGFGSDAQALHPFSGLQDGFVKLA